MDLLECVQRSEPRYEVALVVCRSARVEDAVALLGRKGLRGPQLEWIDGLYVVVVVDEDRSLPRTEMCKERVGRVRHGQMLRVGPYLAQLVFEPRHHLLQTCWLVREGHYRAGFGQPPHISALVCTHELAQRQANPFPLRHAIRADGH